MVTRAIISGVVVKVPPLVGRTEGLEGKTMLMECAENSLVWEKIVKVSLGTI
ncbi:MAG: hypothetical protein JRN20_09510 [Nitrososphaerota archaeon]|nr:hypothetical protein [Nitrososphaerota archaeon]